jgi:hypothetical protein
VEDGQLRRRVERGAVRLVNQNVVLGNQRDDVRVDEVVDQAFGRRVVDICRVDAGGVAVLGELFFLECSWSLLVSSCGSGPGMVSHAAHTVARCTPPGSD